MVCRGVTLKASPLNSAHSNTKKRTWRASIKKKKHSYDKIAQGKYSNGLKSPRLNKQLSETENIQDGFLVI